MARPKGSKNVGTPQKEAPQLTFVTGEEKDKLSEVFTCIQKDFIGVQDLMDTSGLSYNLCAKLIREIKAVSDICRIQGYVHRADYYLYLSRRFEAGQTN